MPNLRTFDAPTLEAALEAVAAEHGKRARIVSAEKVRDGGIAGFFAKERYEVSVEVPGEENRPGEGDGGTPNGAPGDTTSTASGAERSHPPAQRSLLEVAEQVSEDERASAANTRGRTTKVEHTVDSVRRHRSEPAAPAASWPSLDSASPSTEGDSFASVLRNVIASTAPDKPANPEPPTPRRSQPLVAVDTMAAALLQEPPGDRPASVALSPLLDLGLPGWLLTGPVGGDDDIAVSLLRALSRAPRASELNAATGEVVAVAGERQVALPAARAAAVQLGLGPDEVVVVTRGRRGPKRITSTAEATAHRRRRRPTRPVVLALCTRKSDRTNAWAKTMLAALDPTTLWAAVSADRKPEDVAAWSAGLGAVDALALAGLDTTVSPAAALSTGLPVALLEGQRATPLLWTTLLMERVEARC